MITHVVCDTDPPVEGMARCSCGKGPGPRPSIEAHVSAQAAPRITIHGAAKIVGRMGAPVRCANCGSIYDSSSVHVTVRYADASVWRAPCCGVESDDRPYVGRAIRLHTREDISRVLGPQPDGTIIRRRIVQPDGTDY